MKKSRKDNFVFALIPARGGSKSIPLKNLALLGGIPLISYVITAAQKCRLIDAIACSTDHPQIAEICSRNGIAVIERPTALSGDDVPVADVMIHAVNEFSRINGWVPEMMPLLQPTSPFLLPSHIESCISNMKKYRDAESAQTITTFPHNYHAFNQRMTDGPLVRFCFPKERKECFNKQLKPRHYIFGNLVVSRCVSLLAGKGVFGDISYFTEIDPLYAFDVDSFADLEYARYLLDKKSIDLNAVCYNGRNA
jgi:CMP-N-acetylneuraminic acid synthetase